MWRHIRNYSFFETKIIEGKVYLLYNIVHLNKKISLSKMKVLKLSYTADAGFYEVKGTAKIVRLIESF